MERNGIKYSEYTNLPALPGGMFWEISDRGSWLRIGIVVETTVPKKFCGIKYAETTELVGHEDYYTYLDRDVLTDDHIKDKAEKVYRDFRNSLDAADRIKELVGFYPPRKL